MLRAYVQKFNVTRNLEKFCKILVTKQAQRLPITYHGSTNKSPKTESSEVNPSMEEPGSLHYIMEQMLSVRVWYPYAHAYPSAGCSYTTAAGCGYCW